MTHFVKTVCFAGALVAAFACGNRRNPAQNQDGSASDTEDGYVEMRYPIEIDVGKKYDKRTIVLQDVAEVTYIPLETNEDVLLNDVTVRTSELLITDSLIVTHEETSGTFFFFGRDGRLISKFSRQGRASNEYSRISNYAVDDQRGEIYVYTHPFDYKIKIYSLNGEYKGTMDLPGLWIKDMQNYDADNLLVWATLSSEQMKELNIGDSFIPDYREYKEPFAPYYLMSKQTGEFRPLPVKVVEFKEGGKLDLVAKSDPYNMHSRTIGISTSPIIRNGAEFFISETTCDTIYSFNRGSLLPYITVKKPSSGDIRTGLVFKTTRYSFLSVMQFYEEPLRAIRKIFGIDHKTGEIFEAAFRNGDIAEGVFLASYPPGNYFKNLPAEHAVITLPALMLTDDRDAGKLTGPLAGIAATLKEDDNPVLMLVEFKK
jgi:hypothetical protein